MSQEAEPNGEDEVAVRFVLACRDEVLEGWQARCVEELRAAPGVALEAVVTACTESDGRPPPRLYRLWRDRAASFPALSGVRVDRVASGAQRVEARLQEGAVGRELVGPGGREPIILDAEFDFLLSFGLPPLQGPLAERPSWGVWAFDFDLGARDGAAAHGLTSVLDGETTATARLLSLDSAGRMTAVLARGQFSVDPRSPTRTTVAPLEEIASWPARACHTIEVDDGPLPPSGGGPEATGGVRVGTGRDALPSDLRMVALGLRVLAAHLSFAWGRLFRHPQWNVGVVDQPVEAFVRDGSSPPVDWYPLEGRTSFLADPFGIEEEGGDATVLCERFDYDTGKGSICRLRVEGGRLRSQPETALETRVHASYPCLVREEEEIYCTPETRSAGEVALYRATRFPEEWERVGSLLPDLAAVDPTVFRHRGRWWLACTEDGALRDARLLLFHAGELTGPWEPHEANPVKIDVTSARPAGTPFEDGGELYRPAQDCSRTYGGAIVINRVDRLTPTEFREEPVATVEPEPESRYPAGRHTLSALGDRTLIDGHRFVCVPDAFRDFLRIWVRDLLGRDDERAASAPAADGATSGRSEPASRGGR